MQRFHSKKPAPDKSASRAAPTPLDAARLEALALAYVARFATSGAKLQAYLLRKLKGRGWETGDPEDVDPDDAGKVNAAMRGEVAALVARFVAARYIDDGAYASARSHGLQRRGYGRRHIAQDLGQAGIAGEAAAAALPGERDGRRAALALARRRRLGPFGSGPLERGLREKQIAILLRAGHRLDSARELVNAASIAAAEAWACGDDIDVGEENE